VPLRTRSPAVARIADLSTWQHAFLEEDLHF